MLSGRITQAVLHGLDRLARKQFIESIPAHLRTGRRGEEDSYFFLRKSGYIIVARNFRTARHRGEIDLIGWVKERGEDVLCFVEVKTRTTRDVKPAHVDGEVGDFNPGCGKPPLVHLRWMLGEIGVSLSEAR